MQNTFWTNTIWYVILAIITILEIILILRKVENRKLIIALYITVTGITFTFEMTVLSFLNAYKYYPMIIPQSPYDDAVVGNYFSQFSVSATALLIAVYNLRYYWFFIFAGIYAGIEELFLYLGIYEHHWYRTWMTVAGLLLLFLITKVIYESSYKKPIGRSLRYIYLFFGVVALHVHTTWLARVFGIHKFNEHFLPEKISAALSVIAGGKIHEAIILVGVYNLFLFVIIMIMYFKKIKWYLNTIIILLLYTAHYFATKFKLMYYKEGWFFILTTILILSMYLYIYILDKLLGQNRKPDLKHLN